MGRELLERLAPGGILPADKAYDTDAIRAEAEGRGTFAEVPPRVIRTLTFAFRPWLHRQRTHIERFFNRINSCLVLPRAATTDRRLSAQLPSSQTLVSGLMRYESAT